MSEDAWEKFNELHFKKHQRFWEDDLWEALQAAQKAGVPIEEFERQMIAALKAKIQWQKDEGFWEE